MTILMVVLLIIVIFFCTPSDWSPWIAWVAWATVAVGLMVAAVIMSGATRP